MHWLLRAGMVTMVLSLGSVALAQNNTAAADERFNQARSLMDSKDYKKACPLFLESYQLDPVPGTLHALADCLAFDGQKANALMRYEQYLQAVALLPAEGQARHAERVGKAKESLRVLQSELGRVLLELPALAPAETEVELDGVVVEPGSVGKDRFVEAGEHGVRVRAPGKEPWETRFTVEAGKQKTIKLRLQAHEEVKEDKSNPLPPPEVKDDQKSGGFLGMSGLRLGGVVVGGIGVAGLITGGVTGGLALTKSSDVSETCKRDAGTGTILCGTPEAKNTLESAKTMATVSTIAFAGGAVLSGAGVVMWILGGKKSEHKTEVVGWRKPRINVLMLGPKETMLGVEGVW